MIPFARNTQNMQIHRQQISGFQGVREEQVSDWLMGTKVPLGVSEKVLELDGGGGRIRTLCMYLMPLNSYFKC